MENIVPNRFHELNFSGRPGKLLDQVRDLCYDISRHHKLVVSSFKECLHTFVVSVSSVHGRNEDIRIDDQHCAPGAPNR